MLKVSLLLFKPFKTTPLLDIQCQFLTPPFIFCLNVNILEQTLDQLQTSSHVLQCCEWSGNKSI